MSFSHEEKNLLEAYFAGDTSPATHQAMEAWLTADPKHPRILAEFGLIDRLIAHEQKQSDAKAIFAALLEAEEAAEPIPFPVPGALEIVNTHADRHAISFKQACSVIGYAAAQGLKARAGTIAGVAAALVVTTALVVFLATRPAPPTFVDDTPIAKPVVATLTATHDAKWTEGALAPGSQLRSGQTLTLTVGFAEITTKRGAVAILEAPATIELTDHSNTLRLHAGKLVGLCETESSQGFLVRTPHMDVTDLGTRFGVDTTEDRRTAVHVLEGSVEAAWQNKTDPALQRQAVEAGQAIAADTSGVAQQVAYEPQRFITSLAEARLRPGFADTNAIWQGQLTGDLSQDKRQADALQVFIERNRLAPADPVAIDMRPDLAWDPRTGVGNGAVAAGQQVDVYLLHLDMINGHDAPDDFVIDFGRPILGVIGSQTLLDRSDAALGVPGVAYPSLKANPANPHLGGPRGINNLARDRDQVDTISISADGQTLRLSLWGGDGSSMDQIRVLVRSEENERNH